MIKYFIFFIVSFFFGVPIFSHAHQKTLWVTFHKDNQGIIKREFIQDLINLFNTDVFIETGTCDGDAVNTIHDLFKKVYTIELSPFLFNRTFNRLQHLHNVRFYLGDSPTLLLRILPSIQGKILFWLDAHYSEGHTAKGNVNTPILAEIEAIRRSGITNAIILIDDIRTFKAYGYTPYKEAFFGYPSINELHKAILTINPLYEFKICGDVAIAYPREEDIQVSKTVQACTDSRMFEGYSNENEQNRILFLEEDIKAATLAEKEAIRKLYTTFAANDPFNLGMHYRLWHALLLKQENKIHEANIEFTKILTHHPNLIHIKSYIN